MGRPFKLKCPQIPTPGFIQYCVYCAADHELTEEYFQFNVGKNKQVICIVEKREHSSQYRKLRRAENETLRIKINEDNKKYRQKLKKENPDRYSSIYRHSDKEKRARAENRDYHNQKERERLKDPIKRQRCRDMAAARKRERTAADPEYKVVVATRDRINSSIKKSALQKTTKTGALEKYFGCTKQELILHIESQFEEWMTWENHGLKTWNIDHIIPFAFFKNNIEGNLHIVLNCKNHRPLCAYENRKKSNKMEQWQFDLLEEIKNDLGIK